MVIRSHRKTAKPNLTVHALIVLKVRQQYTLYKLAGTHYVSTLPDKTYFENLSETNATAHLEYMEKIYADWITNAS